MIRRRATPKKLPRDAVEAAAQADAAAAVQLDGTAEEREAAALSVVLEDPAVIVPGRVGEGAFGFTSDHQHHANEVIRQSWRGAPQLMALLSEKNVQRVRKMFDSKSDDDGLLLSEFLFVLHQALVRWSYFRTTPPLVTPPGPCIAGRHCDGQNTILHSND